MNKILVGLLVGGFLGIFDGWSAIWTHPEDQEVRTGIMAIIMMGIFKGLVAGAVTCASSGSSLKASINAFSSMRLLVVSGSEPNCCSFTSSFSTQTNPQPPGPGLPSHEPSVKTPSFGPAEWRSSTSSGVWISSNRGMSLASPLARSAARPAAGFLPWLCLRLCLRLCVWL